MKIGIIGAGNIGSNIASLLISQDLASEILLIDINEKLALGKMLDLSTLSVILDKNIKINSTLDYSKLKDFDIVVITAGITRKEGQSREELAKINVSIVGETSKKIAEFSPNAIIIVVTNPLDLMVYACYKNSCFNKNKIIGMAGELDSARAKLNLAKLKNISPIDAKINVFGMHNDEMIIQTSQDVTKDEFQTIKDETINAGANITKLLGTSAYYAPAAAVVKMVKAIKNGGNVIASVLDDEISFGKEIKLSKKGVEKIVENEVYKSVDTSNFIKLKKSL
ncbi:lactate/malate family dehydrogenase [Campylobacter ureolyticus]|uniref:Malate dehydrogenase n=1 Tax=Campylobacter ureolyticus TaxID=827 RepID=A0A9Q4KQ74_9BACT|nr:hypothetical protein [Campylobacter ureolyticus]MCZ6103608.1 hypothetical protein [Campylobacter ureolyticus]MCZ6161706.1 hypothetical protein [Campylobacter ureolyticus]MCZ6170704.1 hypothetical protein [Campylobacter ureolyticus]MDU4982161.1 hypothetical protein [Campylobacter ureolyticus]